MIYNSKVKQLTISKFLLFFICFTIFWKLWAIPRGFPFPLSYINILGLNRISFMIAIIYLYWNIKIYGFIKIPIIGLRYLILFFAGIIISVMYNISFSNSAQLIFESISPLNFLDVIINGIGFIAIFVVIFNDSRNLNFFTNFLLLGSFIILLLTVFHLADNFVIALGSVSQSDTKFATESVYALERTSFPTLDDNNFGPLLVFLAIASINKYLLTKNIAKKIFSVLNIFLCLFLIIKTISRSTILILVIILVIWIILNFTRKAHRRKLLIVISFFIILIFLFSNFLGVYFLSLFDRFDRLINNFTDYTLSSYRSSYGYDNYHARLILAIMSLPDNLTGWIFGNGGIAVNPSLLIKSYSHIDISNWIYQWGLISFIPLILYILTLLKYLWKYKFNFLIKGQVEKNLFHLRNLGICMLIGVLLMMFNTPLFFLLWFILGFVTSIVIVLEKNAENLRIIDGN